MPVVGCLTVGLPLAQYGDMRKSSRLQERFERQAADLLAIIQIESPISTAELAFRTGMSETLYASVSRSYRAKEALAKVVEHNGRRLPCLHYRSKSELALLSGSS
jgi:hypothetical protein